MKNIEHNGNKYVLIEQKCDHILCQDTFKRNSYEKGCANPWTALLCPCTNKKAGNATSIRRRWRALCELRQLLSGIASCLKQQSCDGIAVDVTHYRRVLSNYKKEGKNIVSRIRHFGVMTGWLVLLDVLIMGMFPTIVIIGITFKHLESYDITGHSAFVAVTTILAFGFVIAMLHCIDAGLDCVHPMFKYPGEYGRPNLCCKKKKFSPYYASKDKVYAKYIINSASAVVSYLEHANSTSTYGRSSIIAKKELGDVAIVIGVAERELEKSIACHKSSTDLEDTKSKSSGGSNEVSPGDAKVDYEVPGDLEIEVDAKADIGLDTDINVGIDVDGDVDLSKCVDLGVNKDG